MGTCGGCTPLSDIFLCWQKCTSPLQAIPVRSVSSLQCQGILRVLRVSRPDGGFRGKVVQSKYPRLSHRPRVHDRRGRTRPTRPWFVLAALPGPPLNVADLRRSARVV